MVRIETVLIVHKQSKVLLGFKNPKKKFGGKWNGFGGGVELGYTIEDTAIKETFDETGIKVKDLKKMGIILFKFDTDEHDHEVHFFMAEEYEGTPNISKDFVEYQWFHVDDLEKIYNQMMPADRYWLPYFVQGKMFKGNVYFDGEFNVINHEIKEVNNLN